MQFKITNTELVEACSFLGINCPTPDENGKIRIPTKIWKQLYEYVEESRKNVAIPGANDNRFSEFSKALEKTSNYIAELVFDDVVAITNKFIDNLSNEYGITPKMVFDILSSVILQNDEMSKSDVIKRISEHKAAMFIESIMNDLSF